MSGCPARLGPDIPACMSRAEYDLWAVGEASTAEGPCVDCEFSWAYARLAEGRCDGYPGQPRTTTAVVDRREQARLRMVRYRARRVTLTR